MFDLGKSNMLKAALLRMADVFPAVVLARGKASEQQGHVLNVRLSDGLLKGRVKGQENQIYDVHIDLRAWPDTPSRCGCADRSLCQHAVACLFALEARESPGGQVSQAVSEPKWGLNAMSFVQEEILNADDLVWYSDLHERGHDFFAYQLGIVVGEQTVSIVPLVAELLGRWDRATLEQLPNDMMVRLPLSAGLVLQIQLGRIKPLLRLLLQYSLRGEVHDTDLHLQRYQLLLMQEAEQAMAATNARWRGTDALRAQLQQLTTLATLPLIDSPDGLQCALRDYQHQGLNWLQFLRTNQFSGVLADDMGLGKTVQTLAHLLCEKESGRMKKASLIVAPTSLMGNWFDEAKRFTPALRVLIFHGATRHQDHFDDYDVVISTYGLIQRDKVRFLDYAFYYLILDEAQFIKNARTKTTQVVQQLRATHRLCLTGTPVENHLGELWSLFHFLMPGLLGDAKQFRQLS